jgi:beta-N-acetylhexosaminidase
MRSPVLGTKRIFTRSLVVLLAVWIVPNYAFSGTFITHQLAENVYRSNGRDGFLALRPWDKPARYSPVPSRKAVEWADSQLRRMTIEEKIGQLVSIGVNATFLNQDSEQYRELRRQVVENHVGGIILFRGAVYESVVLVNRMQELSRLPLLISADLEAGAGMRFDDTINFPWNMAVGATGNPEYARRQGAITAREARALGVQQIYAPVVDVNNNAANPVINVRSYGEDPSQVAKFASAFVEGAQSENVIATAKHFPGHGDTAVDSHRGLPVIDVDVARLKSVEFVPFRSAIDAGVGSVMVGHIGLPRLDPTVIKPIPREKAPIPPENALGTVYGGSESEVVVEKATVPATLSPVLGKILRDDLGFKGLIVTDALDMSGLTIYFNREEAAVRAVLAGADVLLKSGDPDAVIRGLRAALKTGRLTEKRIEESARKVLAAKYDLGVVKQRITPLDAVDRSVSSREALSLAQEIAEHAVTLVRNDQKLVPLSSLRPDARIVNIAITNGDDRLFVAQPFVAAMAKAGRRMESFVLDARSTQEELKEAFEATKAADIVIASLYGRVRSGQARSVGLPDTGADALRQLIEAKRPLVGISFGNPYLLQSFPELKTYMVLYGDMPSLQQASARALAGQIDITGRLPITLPSQYARGTGIQIKAQAQVSAITQ